MSETLARTPLYDLHAELGGRLVPFAGWEMPVQYTGIIEEHMAVRKTAGLFDVSHMGEARVRGQSQADEGRGMALEQHDLEAVLGRRALHGGKAHLRRAAQLGEKLAVDGEGNRLPQLEKQIDRIFGAQTSSGSPTVNLQTIEAALERELHHRNIVKPDQAYSAKLISIAVG